MKIAIQAADLDAERIDGTGNFLDAVITNKEGRLVLSMGGEFPNHGMAVVNGNKYSLENIQEYRIANAHPVKISDNGEGFTFFCEKINCL